MSVAKILPNSLEAEQAVLACVITDEDAPFLVFSALKSDDFYSNAHKDIFNCMFDIFKDNKPVNFITVVDKLENKNLLESVGGVDYISNLTTLLPQGAGCKHYIDIVKNHSMRRKLISASSKIAENCFNNENGIEDLAMAEKTIFDISEQDSHSSLEHVSVELPSVIEKMEKLSQDASGIRGLETGLKDLDNITNGLQQSDLIILAARPGVGKTSLAMNIAINASVFHNKYCAIFSLEMSKEQLYKRAICSLGKVNMTSVLKCNLNEPDWQKIWLANKQLMESNLYVDSNSANTPTDILSKCRRLKQEKGLDLVVIDYLQLMGDISNNGFKTSQNLTQAIGERTRMLKIAAKELNVPIILLSQLSREVEKRDNHKPILADLRDSGSIEQDADIVMFLYNPDKYNDKVEDNAPRGVVELELAKHRGGETGTIKLKWVGQWVRFFDIDSQESLPKTFVKKEDNGLEELKPNQDIENAFEEAPIGEPPTEQDENNTEEN